MTKFRKGDLIRLKKFIADNYSFKFIPMKVRQEKKYVFFGKSKYFVDISYTYGTTFAFELDGWNDDYFENVFETRKKIESKLP
jgi:hypothetical protein